MWNESDVAKANELANSCLGKAGRMLELRAGVEPVVLVTSEHGKIWYGDIDFNSQADREKLMKLSRGLEMAVYAMPDALMAQVGDKNYDVTDGIAMIKGSDMQIINSRYAYASV